MFPFPNQEKKLNFSDVFKQDDLLEAIYAHKLGEDTSHFDRLVELSGFQKLFKVGEKLCHAKPDGLLGKRSAKLFATLVYEGATQMDASPQAIKGLFAGAYLSLLCKGFAIQKSNSPFVMSRSFERLLDIVDEADPKNSLVTKEVFDFMSLVLFHDPSGCVHRRLKNLHEKIITDAFFMALVSGNEDDVFVKTTQFSNLLLGDVLNTGYVFNLTRTFKPIAVAEEIAKKKAKLPCVTPFKRYVPKTQWGRVRSFEHNYQNKITKILGAYQ